MTLLVYVTGDETLVTVDPRVTDPLMLSIEPEPPEALEWTFGKTGTLQSF